MTTLAKAEIRQLDAGFKDEIEREKWVVVQFNPETLKVAYANQIEKPEGSGDQRGAQAQLFVGAGSTKMSCQLWFDVTAPQPKQPDGTSDFDDVRKLTNKVSHFITPKEDGKKFVPPAVRFLWGSFQFDGIMESLEESLEFFSPEGKPLRASVSISLVQQKILVFPPKPVEGAPQKNPPGTKPTAPVQSGGNVQKMAGQNWQETAQKNNIEDPLHPQIGIRIVLGRD